MKANEIILILLSEFQTDKAGLATILEVHKSTIHNIFTGHTKKISSNIAQRIVKLRPDINYDFLIGNNDQFKLSVEKGNTSTRTIYMPTHGKSHISISEISLFFVENVDEFEKQEIIKMYKESIKSQAKIEVLQEQRRFQNTLKREDNGE